MRRRSSQATSLILKCAGLVWQALASDGHDESNPCSARVSAASAILRFIRESPGLDDLAQRLARLEQQLAAGPPKRAHRDVGGGVSDP